jgi:predicted metal-binding protein
MQLLGQFIFAAANTYTEVNIKKNHISEKVEVAAVGCVCVCVCVCVCSLLKKNKILSLSFLLGEGNLLT